MNPRGASPWVSSEPGALDCVRQIGRMARRARRRPASTVVLALLLSALATLAFVLKERTFAPRIILRVVEADRDTSTAPRPNRRLREHVRDTVFTSESLYAVMERHGLYPSLRESNPRAALESFREDILIDVYRNYFIEERSATDPPRSARIALGYRSEDPSQAVLVARDLGRLVVAHESKRRREQANLALRGASAEAAFARSLLLSRQEQIAEISNELRIAHDERTWLEALSLSSSLEALNAEVDRAERMKAALELGAAFEQGGLGLRFDLVEDGAVRARERLDAARVLQAALVAFLILTPLAGLAVGAFSRTIDDEEDVERLGLPVIGTLVPDASERGSR